MWGDASERLLRAQPPALLRSRLVLLWLAFGTTQSAHSKVFCVGWDFQVIILNHT